MTIGFDRANFLGGTANPITDSNTPNAALSGVLVLMMHDTSPDLVTNVTYGGVALTRVRSNLDSSGGVTFRTYAYFLGSGVPAGTQNLVVTRTGDRNFIGYTIGLTGASNLEVVDDDGIDGNAANPQVALQYAGRTCLAFCLMGHTAAIATVTSLANQTRVAGFDQGAWCIALDRQTAPGAADFTIGYTVATNDNAFSAVAISEVVASDIPVASGELMSLLLADAGVAGLSCADSAASPLDLVETESLSVTDLPSLLRVIRVSGVP